MVKDFNYRGFSEIHGDGTNEHPIDIEYAIFDCKIPGIRTVIYRPNNNRNTWCLGCSDLGIEETPLCPANTDSSWKSAIDIAILVIEKAAKAKYEQVVGLGCNGISGDKHIKLKEITGEDGTEAPVFAVDYNGLDVRVFQTPYEMGEGLPWYLTSKALNIKDHLLTLDGSKEAKKKAIEYLKFMISTQFKNIYSLEE